MAFTKSIAAAVTALGLLSAPASAGDLFGTYGASKNNTMVSYSLPFGGTAKSMDEAAFALTFAPTSQAKSLCIGINRGFDIRSMTLNGINIAEMSDRLTVNEDHDGYTPIVAIGIVVGAAILVKKRFDDHKQTGKHSVCPSGFFPHPDFPTDCCPNGSTPVPNQGACV